MGLLGNLGEKLKTMLTDHAVSNIRRMSTVNREDAMRIALEAMKQQTKRINNAVPALNYPPKINQLLADTPDDLVDPWTNNVMKVGKRIFNANITEADEIVVNITMIDGSVGQITIKATTLAQIIIDRNARALPDQPKAPDPTCIDVGDGGIGGGEQTNPKVVKLVNADELLAASKKGRLTNVVDPKNGLGPW